MPKGKSNKPRKKPVRLVDVLLAREAEAEAARLKAEAEKEAAKNRPPDYVMVRDPETGAFSHKVLLKDLAAPPSTPLAPPEPVHNCFKCAQPASQFLVRTSRRIYSCGGASCGFPAF